MADTLRTTLAVGIVSLVVGAALLGGGIVLASDQGSVPSAGGNPDATGDRQGTITVSASGTAETAPDQAVVRLEVEATATDPTVARQRVAENTTAVREALSELGLNESAVRTTGFDIYEDRVRLPREGEAPASRYRASHRLRVVVDDVDAVGTVIDTAVEGGATGVGGVQFTLAESTESRLHDRAIEEAMGRARKRAHTIGDGANVTVTEVAWARTGDVDVPRPQALAFAAAGGDGGTSIESGPVTVRATVTVAYRTAG